MILIITSSLRLTLMLALPEVVSSVALAAAWAWNLGLIASSGQMMLDFFTVLDLLAARTGHALPRTVVLEVPCDLALSIEPFTTVARALH